MPSERAERWDKLDLKPKRWWGYTILIFILGTLLPPLAVAARFGIGRDFWINVVLTLCGYIPGHFHNFYIQNIRNNKSDRRTPKWAQKHGLIDMTALERRRKRAQWANRYKDRAPQSTWEGAEYAEGQEPGGSSVDISNDHSNNDARPGSNKDLWRPEDEQYYGKNENRKSGRWHYPTNFDDVTPDTDSPRKKKSKKDRWARTEDAYVMEAEASERRKRKKSKKNKSTVGESDTHSRASGSTTEFPEDAEGGLYGGRTNTDQSQSATPDRTENNDLFEHQF